jgi:predicted aminopeptidase
MLPFAFNMNLSTQKQMHRSQSSARKVLLLVAMLSLQSLLSGCYLMQAAQGQLAVSTKREPISNVIADPKTPSTIAARLRLIAAAREFASQELGLPDNESYRTYVNLKRDYVVWNVFATDRFSVDARQWCFPIAGCVVYRGYFSEQAAQRYARRARLNGSDASVAGTAAYSTLGHFNDPVLSSMLRWSDAQIAATLFHELAHQVLYVPNDSSFNEAFASVVEEESTRRWLKHRDANAINSWLLARTRGIEFTQLLLDARENLRVLYKNASPQSRLNGELHYQKQIAFGRLKFDYWQLKQRWNGYAGYDAWFNRTLSNADLISAATYQDCVPGLERLLESVDRDLPRFYEAASKLNAASRKKVCSAVE